MHPMFVELYLEADADELSADEQKRRRGRRARRNRLVMTTKARGPRPARGPQPRGRSA